MPETLRPSANRKTFNKAKRFLSRVHAAMTVLLPESFRGDAPSALDKPVSPATAICRLNDGGLWMRCQFGDLAESFFESSKS
jgi:hypothetical protein